MTDALSFSSTVVGFGAAALAAPPLAPAGIELSRAFMSSTLMLDMAAAAWLAMAGLDIISCACFIMFGSMFLVICTRTHARERGPKASAWVVGGCL